MSEALETKPKLADDARLLEVGEIINDGDLHWNTTVKHWVAVTPQGEERVAPGQHGQRPRPKRSGRGQPVPLALGLNVEHKRRKVWSVI